MTKNIKNNPYSDNLARALRAVAELSTPDYILAPLDPTPDMQHAGAVEGNVTPEQAAHIYRRMIATWADVGAAVWNERNR